MKAFLTYLFPVLLVSSNLYAQTTEELLSTMTLEEKIGQLFIATIIERNLKNIPLITKKNYPTNTTHIKNLITQYHIGGIIFLGTSNIETQIATTKELQALSSIPLFVCQDLEPGLLMHSRLPELPSYPSAQELGAMSDTIIYTVAKQIGKLCNHLGVNVNFAPCIDINTNPDNPVIGDRSFGTTPEQVSKAALAFMHGLQSEDILTCAKHFPGHGDTSVNSHRSLPLITHDIKRLTNIEFVPFKSMIQNNIDMIMVGHLAIPALDNSGAPASLSKKIITDFLRNKMCFTGLIISDALDMNAVTKYYNNIDLAVSALQAGNDLLLCCCDIPGAIKAIKQAIINGVISEQELDEHVLRILRVKQKL